VIKWGTKVTVEGQVTVPPGLFSVETIYIQDGSGGILIYLREGTYPPLKEGDWVRIIGELRDYHGEREIRVEEGGIEFLKDGEAVTPVEIAMAEVEEGKEGLLAETIGIVTDVEGWAFYLDDGGGEVKVYIREATGMERKIRVGEALVVVGVVSQYASSAPYEGGYRLLPRYEGDIRPAPVYLPPCGEERTGP
jgi:DNA/RNA endonuclease YhcR with UshA esterase domain